MEDTAQCCFRDAPAHPATWNLTQVTPVIGPADATTHGCDEHVIALTEDGVIRYELTLIEAVGVY
jgi:hypothetical protein